MLGLVTAAIRYLFFVFGGDQNSFAIALLFMGILLHGVSYDFYFVTAYIYVDNKAPVAMRNAAQGLITLACQGIGSLLGYRLGGYLMQELFAYKTPQHGMTFNWSGMWLFGCLMIVVITAVFMLFFRDGKQSATSAAGSTLPAGENS